ncbi:MAG: hypothetical protein HY905_14795 [Deltaproteobacteria bacterium]|nr:hypothetical protein [Deltaproteobacteria bacterium]
MSEADHPAGDAAGSLDELFAGAKAGASDEGPREPFKFLDPYEPGDADIFFGRGYETAELFARFHRSRLLVIYGESGSGKTSLVQCGLRSRIPPEDALFLTVRSSQDPLGELRAALQAQSGLPAADVPAETVRLLGEAVLRKGKTLALVFDQFEELYLFQPPAVRERLARELSAWLAADIDIRIVLVIREEYLARLTETEEQLRRVGRELGRELPGLYDNRLWVRRMSSEQAREAIVEPCRRCGVGIDAALARELVGELTREGRGAELPILQVVLDTLYRGAVARNPDAPWLHQAEYESLGRMDTILGRFLEDRIAAHAEPERSRQVLKALVSAEGTRRPGSAAELRENAAQYGEPLDAAALEEVLRRLVDDRILRQDPGSGLFELRHDSLARQVHGWMSGLERELAEVRAALDARWREHLARGRSPGSLLDAGFLEYLAPYRSRLRMAEDHSAFVAESERAQTRARSRRRWIAAVVMTLAVATLAGLAGWALWGMQQAEESEDEALLARNAAEEQRAAAEKSRGEAEREKAHAEEQRTAAEEQRAAAEKNREEAEREKAMAEAQAIAGEVKAYQLLPGGLDEVVALMRPFALLVGEDQAVHSGLLAMVHVPAALVLPGHRGPVGAVAFSPDARLFATASYDGTGRVWDAGTGVLASVLEGHTGPIQVVVFSPDGRLVATGSVDGSARLWDAVSGKVRATLLGHSAAIQAAVFSPDGQTLATGSTDGTVRVWSCSDGALLTTIDGHPDLVTDVDFSQDGRVLATSCWDGVARLWDPGTGRLLRTLRGHAGPIQRLAFSQDGGVLATASEDKTTRLWNPMTGALLRTLRGHTAPVRALALSPDGRFAATGSEDESVRLWDAATGSELQLLKGHDGEVHTVAFSPDGRFLATAAFDTRPRVWDVASGAEVLTLIGHPSLVTALAFSPDGAWIGTGSTDDTAHLWGFAPELLPRALEGPTAGDHAVGFSPDGRLLAVGCNDGEVRVWDPASGATVRTLQVERVPHLAVAFSPDGTILATGVEYNDLQLWDAESGALLRTLQGYPFHNGILFSPDGSVVAGKTREAEAAVWDPRTGELLQSVGLPDDTPASGAFSTDGGMLAVAVLDGTMTLWDRAAAGEPRTFRAHATALTGLAFASATGLLVTASWDGAIRLWNPADGMLSRTIGGDWGSVLAAGVAPDGRTIVGALGDASLRQWNPSDGSLLHQLGQREMSTGGLGSAVAFSFSPDGQWMAVGWADGMIQVTDATGTMVVGWFGGRFFLGGTGGPSNALFAPGGSQLAFWPTRRESPVRLWDVHIPTVEEAMEVTGRRTNLRVCRESRAVVPVVPYPPADFVWAPEASCGSSSSDATPPVAPPEAREGESRLTLFSDPSAFVSIDGRPTGYRTPLVEFQVRPGPRRVCFMQDSGLRSCRTITVPQGSHVIPMEAISPDSWERE